VFWRHASSVARKIEFDSWQGLCGDMVKRDDATMAWSKSQFNSAYLHCLGLTVTGTGDSCKVSVVSSTLTSSTLSEGSRIRFAGPVC
jgi:hypothetical protein